jgi:hypothetical protein
VAIRARRRSLRTYLIRAILLRHCRVGSRSNIRAGDGVVSMTTPLLPSLVKRAKQAFRPQKIRRATHSETSFRQQLSVQSQAQPPPLFPLSGEDVAFPQEDVPQDMQVAEGFFPEFGCRP